MPAPIILKRPLPDTRIVSTLRDARYVHRIYKPTYGAWDTPRQYGPLFRFDHHDLPPATHPTKSVWYAAESLRGAVAEAFGGTRILDASSAQRYVCASITASPALLSLLSVGPSRIGATHELCATTNYDLTQEWARAIYEDYTSLHGIRWKARNSGSLSIVLNDRQAVATCMTVILDAPLNHPDVWPRLVRAAKDLAFTVIAT